MIWSRLKNYKCPKDNKPLKDIGHYHDEMAEITAIDENGELNLTFPEATKQVQEFLKNTDGYMANDFIKESNPQE